MPKPRGWLIAAFLGILGAVTVVFGVFINPRGAVSQQAIPERKSETVTKELIATDDQLESEVAKLNKKVRLLIEAGFQSGGAFLSRDDRRIYLNLNQIRSNPEITKLDRIWHSLAVHLRYKDTLLEPQTFEMTPCLEHREHDYYNDPAHAILIDPAFNLTEQQWQQRYQALEMVGVHSLNDASRVYFFLVGKDEAVHSLKGNSLKGIKVHYGRKLIFDDDYEILELRRVLRNIFFEVPRGGLQKPKTEKRSLLPRRKKAQRPAIITPTLPPAPPPDFNNLPQPR